MIRLHFENIFLSFERKKETNNHNINTTYAQNKKDNTGNHGFINQFTKT